MMNIKELKEDRDKLIQQIQEAAQIAVRTDTQVNFLKGALAYVEDNIKKAKK